MTSSKINFHIITELPGGGVSKEQLERFFLRYSWARSYCYGKDVVEVGCGGGQGLGFIAQVAASLIAGDIDGKNVQQAQKYYGDRVSIETFSAETLPFESSSKDVIIFFEAIYYLDDVKLFLKECLRVLRPGGVLLISSTNPELFDFTPSVFSKKYYSVRELDKLLKVFRFDSSFFGDTSLIGLSVMGTLLRFLKGLATKVHMVPISMKGKAILRRLVFGKLLTMPRELTEDSGHYSVPPVISQFELCNSYKGYFCAAKKQ